MPDKEVDENVVFTGEMPSASVKPTFTLDLFPLQVYLFMRSGGQVAHELLEANPHNVHLHI
ncbi:MAG TPA: hypothetical protein VEU97_10505 [Ktedonobacteraceae bacterium]|nr:hypothetical protein [Ktedonobacteraceae bacterium]